MQTTTTSRVAKLEIAREQELGGCKETGGICVGGLGPLYSDLFGAENVATGERGRLWVQLPLTPAPEVAGPTRKLVRVRAWFHGGQAASVR